MMPISVVHYDYILQCAVELFPHDALCLRLSGYVSIKPPLHLSRSKPFWNNGTQRESRAVNLLGTKKSYRYPEQTGKNV